MRAAWLGVLIALPACAGSGPATRTGGLNSAAVSDDDRIAEMIRTQDDQARRIAELEGRLKLLEAESRRARGNVDKPTATVRIGESPSLVTAHRSEPEPEPEPPPSFDDPPPSAASAAKRPSLKLHRTARPAGASARAELPPLPVTNETLPVVPLPEARRNAQLAGGNAAGVSDAATAAYRAALGLLRERRFDEAALALSKFVADNPDHVLVDRAVYWGAEARYAKRDYRPAKAEFERVLERFPQSEKAPDALYKIGMCLIHLGAEAEAQRYFRRLREQYPQSEAASLASREGST